MKVYRKKGGKILVLTDNCSSMFGGTEVVFMNYSLKGTLQVVFLDNYEYLREATLSEIDKFWDKKNRFLITPTEEEIKKFSK